MRKKELIKGISLAIGTLVCTGMVSAVTFAEAETSADGYYEVSCPLFSVRVPESLKDICTIDTGENSISFYENISRESFGGFVGEISAFHGPEEYGSHPAFSRGGEIDYPDGSKLDIVWEYPTDVQFDITDEQSTENYNLISEALPQIGEELCPADEGAVFVRQEDIDTTGIYADILDKLRADLTEKKSAEDLLADDFSYLYAYFYKDGTDPLGTIGYAYTDINSDGYSELVIGIVGETDIYDMYAPVNGEPVHIFSSGERNMYNICGYDGASSPFIRNDASSSAYYSEIGIYNLDSNQPELFKQFALVVDGERDPENPYFFDYGFEDPEPTTEEDWNERLQGFEEAYDPGYAAIG